MQQDTSSVATKRFLVYAVVGAGVGAFLGLMGAMALACMPRLMDRVMPRMMASMMPKMMQYFQEAQVEPPCARIIRDMLEQQHASAGAGDGETGPISS